MMWNLSSSSRNEFPPLVAGLSLRNWVKSLVIRRELEVEPLLLCVKRSQIKWFGHLIRMLPGGLPLEVFLARPTGRGPQSRPTTCWQGYMSRLARELIGIFKEDLGSVARDRDGWNTPPSLLQLWRTMDDGLPFLPVPGFVIMQSGVQNVDHFLFNPFCN